MRASRMLGAVWALVLLGRPHFLAGGLLLYALGAALAVMPGAPPDWRALLWGQAAVTAMQWMTHYANDYYDLEADRANRTPTAWSGGSRVLVTSAISPHWALAAALALAGVSMAATAVLALGLRPGALTGLLFAGTLLGAWGYSAPPLRLHSTGWGELVGAMIVAGMTPLLGFYVQAGKLAWRPLLALLPLVCIQFAMLLAVSFPDARGDALAGKRTLVVRLGGARAARVHAGALGLAYGLLPLMVAAGLPWPVALGAALSLPLATWQARAVLRGWNEPATWNGCAWRSVGLVFAMAAAELAATLLPGRL